MNTLFDTAHQEVLDLHVQIENRFHNKPDTTKRLNFLSYFHPEFTMIGPDGVLRHCEDLKKWYQQAAGSRPQVVITIKQFTPLLTHNDLIMVSYEEHQQVTSTETLRRLSTAIFVPTQHSHQPLLWRHLHETWIR